MAAMTSFLAEKCCHPVSAHAAYGRLQLLHVLLQRPPTARYSNSSARHVISLLQFLIHGTFVLVGNVPVEFRRVDSF